ICVAFFFQAEDGIRDPLVTGVQTCALPISPTAICFCRGKEVWRSGNTVMDSFSRLPLGENILQWAAGDRLVFASEKDGWAHLYRSEERRVGKEWSSRWSPCQ